ncbi:Uncharacterized protein dnm_024150 [Desulfonema magnum]|uniref:Uncharacterized protein n=1 Tax=Desulfonema magnum TaxID=45655 RepID=A0A975BJE1_9BACT|nr:Uncharacterized protein dnm_024150 [Desulfonema magnum]
MYIYINARKNLPFTKNWPFFKSEKYLTVEISEDDAFRCEVI